MRWVAPAESHPGASARERALWCLRAARIAADVPGWSFVPASVDLLGRVEPAYLYTSGDVISAQQRLEGLRAALEASAHAPLDPALARREFALRDERLHFARAQLSSELFRLRALHLQTLGLFESVANELELLSLEDLGPLDPHPSRCGVVGPTAAWSESLARLGTLSVVSAPASASLDEQIDTDLQRMWNALGGVEAWRDLSTLRIQSQLDVAGSPRSQGIEQWIDFAHERFVLAQAIGTQETMVVVSASQAWSLGGIDKPELSAEQARKLRSRQERTLFALLRRLAQPNRGGLGLRLEGERLLVNDAGRELCWLEWTAQGLPLRLGYQLDGEPKESLYEFQDWNLGASLPYPLRTLQLDRNAVVEMRSVEPGAAPDPQIWERAGN